jgi:hypothetical protein
MMKRSTAMVFAALLTATALNAPPAQGADPTTSDCLNASDGSVTLRNAHKLRGARAQLLVCGAASCPADIRNECMKHVEELNSAIPTVVFEAKDAAGNDVLAVKVTMDGEVIAERLEGTPISLDPGSHSFTFESAGQAPITKTLVIRESQKDRREGVTFGAGAPAAAPPPPSAPAPQAAPAPQPVGPEAPPPTTDSGDSTKRILGFVIGGVGIAAVGIAIIEQVTALGRDSDSKTAAASSDPAVQATVHTLHEQALDAQNYALASGIVGAVALGTGAVLIVTSSGSGATAKTTGWQLVPDVSPRRGGLVLRTTW